MPFIAQKAVDLASPGPIGGTTPAAGSFTSLNSAQATKLATVSGNVVVGAGSDDNLHLFQVGGYIRASGIYGSATNLAHMRLDMASVTDALFIYNGATKFSINSTGNAVVSGELQVGGPVSLPSYTTATRPTYGAGKVIFDTTLGKMCIGGAAAWEVVTSA